MVGGLCAFLSCYLMLRGWSLIGDALSHSIVPGVAGAYMLGLPFALGAFLSGGLAAGSMLFLNQRSRLKEDAIIGLIFSSFFGIGLFMVSLNPMSVNIQTIILGNILAIAPEDILQLAIIGVVSLTILLLKWKDLMVVFFDENHARSIGLNPGRLKLLFFTLLSVSTVAALQTVGAFLVICLVVTPGATAWLLTDRFPRLLAIAVAIGSLTSFFGAWLSYWLDGATGTIMGIVFSGMFGAGLVLYVSIQSEVHLDHILFGDMLGISLSDIVQTTAIALGIALIIGLKWKDLLLHAFDPHQAKASGLNTALLHYGLLCMIALTIVATLKSVGIILSISLLIAPGAIAILMTRKFSHALWLAVVMSVITSFMGVYLSFFIDSAPAPTIVVLFSLLFVITFIYATLRDRRLENQLQLHDV